MALTDRDVPIIVEESLVDNIYKAPLHITNIRYSDEEKIKIITRHFAAIMETHGLNRCLFWQISRRKNKDGIFFFVQMIDLY
jgi:hypothetical protein